jgi:hypothetical protein
MRRFLRPQSLVVLVVAMPLRFALGSGLSALWRWDHRSTAGAWSLRLL